MTAADVLAAIAIGAGATLLTDLWNLLLKRAFGLPSLNLCLLGRWVLHMPAGTFKHASIAAAPRKPLECAAGWMAHYAIGVTLALGFSVLATRAWLARPTLLPAVLFGISTAVFPLFIMQPAFGLGLASSRAARPNQARMKSLMTHTVFGVGLWLCAIGLRALLAG